MNREQYGTLAIYWTAKQKDFWDDKIQVCASLSAPQTMLHQIVTSITCKFYGMREIT